MKKLLYVAIFVAGFVASGALKKAISPTYQQLSVSQQVDRADLPSHTALFFDDPVIQEAPAFCGPASIQAVLRSVGREIDQSSIVEASAELSYWGVYFAGTTLDELSRLATINGLQSEANRPSSLDELRAVLRNLQDDSKRIIVNYSRMPISGENIGHHTPVVAYDETADRVVLQDVTEGYGSYSLPVAVLLTAIMTPDSETGKQRGLLVLSDDNSELTNDS